MPQSTDITIRPAKADDSDAVVAILEPTIRAGETYVMARDMSREAMRAYWMEPPRDAFVAEDPEGHIVGTYYLQANQEGGGSHVANCGYMTAPWATGRGVASAMCGHSLEMARLHGFRAMQYNFVIATNEQAIKLWRRFGFSVVGRVPEAFAHPTEGYVDVLVMHRFL